MWGAGVLRRNKYYYKNKQHPFRFSSSKFDARADCSDWRRFRILLADFDFVTWQTSWAKGLLLPLNLTNPGDPTTAV